MSDRQIGPVAKNLMTGKARISDPKNWCTKMFTRDHQRCAVGALISDEMIHSDVATWEKLAPVEDSVRALKESCWALHGTCNIYGVNDTMGHEHVMAIYDHAINRAISEKK